MFRKKTIEVKDKELYKLAVKYKRQLEKADTLPPNSKEMYKLIRKAGL